MINIDPIKLQALRTYFLEGGDSEEEAVMEQLKTKKSSTVAAYIEALKAKFPKDFGAEDEVNAEASYFLKDENNVLVELEVFKQKGDKTIFAIKEPKELVTLIIKGVATELDLYQLRKLPVDTERYGVRVGQLIALATLAV